MMPPLLHVCSGLARPEDEPMLARGNGIDIETTGQIGYIIVSGALSPWRQKDEFQDEIE